MLIKGDKMLIRRCDICKKAEMDTLVYLELMSHNYRDHSTSVWDICKLCWPKVLELLGPGGN